MSFVRKVRLPSGAIRFRAVWEIGGRKHSRSFDREKAAKQHAALMADQTGRLGIGDGERRSFSGFAQRWIGGIEARGERSPTTIANCKCMLRKVEPSIGRLVLAEISPTDIDDIMTALLRSGLSPASVRTVRATLSVCFEAARRAKLIVANPVRDSMPVGGRRAKPRAFSRDELKALIAQADASNDASVPGLAVVVRLLAVTGLRRSEVLGLRWSRVDLDLGTITVDAAVVPGGRGEPILREWTKTTASGRTISIPADLCERLRQHRIEQMKARLIWGRE